MNNYLANVFINKTFGAAGVARNLQKQAIFLQSESKCFCEYDYLIEKNLCFSFWPQSNKADPHRDGHVVLKTWYFVHKLRAILEAPSTYQINLFTFN